jgi:hypothetical protein
VWASASASRKSRRNRRESIRTGSRKPGLQRTQRAGWQDIPRRDTHRYRTAPAVLARPPAKVAQRTDCRAQLRFV